MYVYIYIYVYRERNVCQATPLASPLRDSSAPGAEPWSPAPGAPARSRGTVYMYSRHSVCIHVCICMCMYIYIYIERERDTQYIYIYIYVYYAHVRGVTDGMGTPDPNPRNLVNWCV